MFLNAARSLLFHALLLQALRYSRSTLGAPVHVRASKMAGTKEQSHGGGFLNRFLLAGLDYG
jgi:hypothetical protein